MSLRSMLPLATFALTGWVAAYTQPTDNTWGPLYKPDLETPVTQGEQFTITWDPEDHPTNDVTVSLVLCHGNSANCQIQEPAVAEKIPAALKEYEWDVPCDLEAGIQKTDTGYGLLIIVDGTGEFQYSTQFSVLENPKCSSSSTSPSGPGKANSTDVSTKTSWLIGEPVSTYTTTDAQGSTLVQTKTFTQTAEIATFTPVWTSADVSTRYSNSTASTLSTATGATVPTSDTSAIVPSTGSPTYPTASRASTTASILPGTNGADGVRWNAAALLVAGVAAALAL